MPTIRLRVCVLGTAVMFAAGGVCLSVGAAADPPAFVHLGYIGGSPVNKSWALGVSGDGTVVVGAGSSAASGLTKSEAFRWTAATGMIGLGDLPGDPFFSSAVDVSDDGSVVVGWGNLVTSQPFAGEACRWVNGLPVGLGQPPEMSWSFGRGVSGDGSVILATAYAPGMSRGYFWTAADGYTSLGDHTDVEAASADGSVIVGYLLSGTEITGFRWTA